MIITTIITNIKNICMRGFDVSATSPHILEVSNSLGSTDKLLPWLSFQKQGRLTKTCWCDTCILFKPVTSTLPSGKCHGQDKIKGTMCQYIAFSSTSKKT